MEVKLRYSDNSIVGYIVLCVIAIIIYFYLETAEYIMNNIFEFRPFVDDVVISVVILVIVPIVIGLFIMNIIFLKKISIIDVDEANFILKVNKKDILFEKSNLKDIQLDENPSPPIPFRSSKLIFKVAKKTHCLTSTSHKKDLVLLQFQEDLRKFKSHSR